MIADRWTPLILRELVLGSTRFNDIARGLPGISRSLLVARLKHLERKGVVEIWPLSTGRGNVYHLTPAGKDLEPILMAFRHWAVNWLYDELDPEDVDAITLMWWMHRRVDPSAFPDQRVVVQFDHTAPEKVTLWMVFERGEASVCIQHPGFESDVIVTMPTAALAEVFAGNTEWKRAVADERIAVAGPSHLVKALPRWFLWSPFGDAMRERVSAGVVWSAR